MLNLVTKTLVQNDGQQLVTRTYHVHVPSGGANGRPVLFFFHGGGGSGQQFANLANFGFYANKGYVMVFPDALVADEKTIWRSLATTNLNPMLDEAFVGLMKDALVADYGVDTNKFYAGGFSNGSSICWQLYLHQAASFQGFCTAGSGQSNAFDGLIPSVRRPWATVIGRQDDAWDGDADTKGAVATAAAACVLNNRSTAAVPAGGTPAGNPPNPTTGTKLFNLAYPANPGPTAMVLAGDVRRVTVDAGHRWFAKPPTWQDNFYMTSYAIEFWKAHAGLPAEMT